MNDKLNQVSNGAVNLLKGLLVVAVGAAAMEGGYIGARAADSDIRLVANGVKELADPTPVLVKNKGLFGKKYVAKLNPFTGKVSPYTGKKAPVNKKAIQL